MAYNFFAYIPSLSNSLSHSMSRLNLNVLTVNDKTLAGNYVGQPDPERLEK